MKVEILSEKENPLLKRRQFEVKITQDTVTPSIDEIKQKISATKEIGKGTIIIDSFKSKYGSKETIGTVKVYETKERAMEVEPRHRLIKNGLIEGEKTEKPKPKEEPKPEEAAKEPKEEKPAEEPKEETKAVKEPKKPDEKEDKKPEEPKEEKPAEEPKPDKKEDKKPEEPKEEKKGE